MTPRLLIFSRMLLTIICIIFTMRSKSGRSSGLRLQQSFARLIHSSGQCRSNVGLNSRLGRLLHTTFHIQDTSRYIC